MHLKPLIESALVGTIAVSALCFPAKIATADEIRLSSGEQLTVDIIQLNEQHIQFEHELLGQLTLPRSGVEFISSQPDDQPSAHPADVALGMLQDEPDEEAGDKEWNFKLVAAAAYATGNTENANFSAIFTGLRETDAMRTALDAKYFYSEDDTTRSENRFTTGIINDWLFDDSPWFIFADARFDYDSFQNWSYRVNSHVGVGYQFYDEDDFKLRGRLGIGFVREFESDNEDFRPEGIIGVEGSWQITAKQSLDFSTYWYPDFDDTGEFRNVNSLAWSLLLDEELNLSLAAGLEHEYQSDPGTDADRHDLRIYAGLQFEL